MTQPATSLPARFEALEPFVASWAIAGSANRALRRYQSQADERLVFYNAAKDLLGPALSYLDRKPLNQQSPQDRRLMDMMLMLAHITQAVEVLGDHEQINAYHRHCMKITRSPADHSA